MVSKSLPFQSLLEYTKNWKNNLTPQNIEIPKAILLPIGVLKSALVENKHKSPNKKTKNATKNV
jgi:hypothetical protein